LRQKCNHPRVTLQETLASGHEALRRTGDKDRTMRVGPMMGLPALLAGFGVELAPLLAESGLPPDSFGDPENRWPVDRLLHLASRGAEATNCPHLCLLLAAPVGPSALGAPLARLLAGALSVERALRGLTMNLHLNGEALVPALATGPDGARFSIMPYALHRQGNDQLEDFALATVANILRFLCGPRWAPLRVTFARREPADRRPYDSFFRAPLEFDAPLGAVFFDAAWLSRRPEPSPHGLAASPLPLTAEDLDIAIRARRAVMVGLAQGSVGVDAVAVALGLGRRTLNRRFTERGTSIRELIATVRLEIAQRLLRDTDLTIADIASTLCYSDVAAFSRAFSAGIGRAPAAWRNAQRAPLSDQG